MPRSCPLTSTPLALEKRDRPLPRIPADVDQAFGRSRGGLTTKPHLARDGRGRLLAMLVTAASATRAITQLHLPGPAQTYYQRRRAQGDGTGEAVRALKRRIARAVYQRLRAALPPADTLHTATA
jgi:transposase